MPDPPTLSVVFANWSRRQATLAAVEHLFAWRGLRGRFGGRSEPEGT